MSERNAALLDALEWLVSEFSANRDEALRAIGPSRLDALLSLGYVREIKGRYDVSEMGRRKLNAERPVAA